MPLGKINPVFEECFMKRYNRKVDIYSHIEKTPDGMTTTITIIPKNRGQYIIREFLDKEGNTACAVFEHNDKKYRHKTHLEAEVSAVDTIAQSEE